MINPSLFRRLARLSSVIITAFLFLFLMVDVGLSMQKESGLNQLFILVASHLMWPGIALALTLLTWKNHKLGTWLFALAGLGYIAMGWGRFSFSVYLIITGPLFLTAIFHGLAWRSFSGK